MATRKSETDKATVRLQKATLTDQAWVVDIDHQLSLAEHKALSRAEKLTRAITDGTCLIILAGKVAVGFMLFDYRFFNQGWIELLVLEEKQRRKGLGTQALLLICKQSTTKKVFTSTNSSNIPMQKALRKAGFSYVGKISGLDEGDPELFYLKERTGRNTIA